MVNEAYLNRLNAEFTRGYPIFTSRLPKARSAHGEVSEIDRLDPIRLRINHQGTDRECDAVRNSTVLGMQPEQPGLATESIGQRPFPELEQQQRQGAAE